MKKNKKGEKMGWEEEEPRGSVTRRKGEVALAKRGGDDSLNLKLEAMIHYSVSDGIKTFNFNNL